MLTAKVSELEVGNHDTLTFDATVSTGRGS